jgi:NitT/TauT family transport system substrate-binding protein
MLQLFFKRISLPVFVAALISFGSLPSSYADTIDYGAIGSPINLSVGYQPYYTESWSGLVMRNKKFYEKYLPKGSKVDFQVGLQGAVIVNSMLAGKEQIGYLGDMPSVVAVSKSDVAPISLVAVLGISKDLCNIFLVRKDAPDFKTPAEALASLNGKVVAAPKGSCVDRFVQSTFIKEKIKPSDYLNQSIEVITSNFRAGKIDAAALWEPTASKLEEEGLAKRVASGYSVNESDGAFLAMRGDLIKARPDIAQAWLNAELDAQLFMADPKNAKEMVDIGMEYANGFTRSEIGKAIYGQRPDQNGSKIRFTMPFSFSADARDLITSAASFLKEIKVINNGTLPSDAINSSFADNSLKARNLKSPIGSVPVVNPPPN